MIINEHVFIYGHLRSERTSFLRFPNISHSIDECESILVDGYGFDSNTFKLDLIKHIKNGRKIIIDASTELIGVGTLDTLTKFDDLSNITIYVNNFEPQYRFQIDYIKHRGCNLMLIPFFIKYMDYYTPDYSYKTILRKQFLFLSGKSKPHRTATIGLLSYYDLIKDGHVSFFGNGGDDNTDGFFYDRIDDYYNSNAPITQQLKVKEGLSKIPNKLTLDVSTLTHKISHNREYNGDYYKVVDFVIVAESDIREGVHFITEKTMKCIQHDKKFILFGSPGELSYLKENVKKYLGKDISHLTDWCDTSYDDIKNEWERLDHIIRIVRDMIAKKTPKNFIINNKCVKLNLLNKRRKN